jgi:hypothetical protein
VVKVAQHSPLVAPDVAWRYRLCHNLVPEVCGGGASTDWPSTLLPGYGRAGEGFMRVVKDEERWT